VSTIKLNTLEGRIVGESNTARPFAPPDSLERGAGFALLALASPVIVAAAAAIALLARRSPFIAHLRIGKEGQPFWMLKLRTMWDEQSTCGTQAGWLERITAEPPGDGKDPSDARIKSRFAAFCRRYSIDELPQLWHVVCGEMSLVGPRPLTQSEIRRYYAGRASELLSVKPGLTGLWQVYGRSAIRFPRRAAMDLALVRKLNARLYWKILLRTLPAVLRGYGAW
jgi:exopolysaccharide production protein ExoY